MLVPEHHVAVSVTFLAILVLIRAEGILCGRVFCTVPTV